MAVIQDFQVNGLFPSKVGGTGVAIKYFPRLLGSSIGAVPTTPSATNATGMMVVNGLNELNGQRFSATAVGNYGSDTGDPSGTVTIKMQAVTPNANTGSYSLLPVYTTIASTTAFVPLVGAAGSWALRVDLYGDTLSGLVGGSYFAYINGALNNSTPKNTDAILSGINFAASPGNVPASSSGGTGTAGGNATPFGLVVGVTFGTSDATNTASMYQFNLTTD